MKLRVGTRGSDLALWQTNWVCERLRAVHHGLDIEQIVIKTHGDAVQDRNFGSDWPVGAFVSALENALSSNEVDFAVHSFKDLQTAETTGLTIAATPARAPVHDMLLTRSAEALDDLPAGARIGTNSPRRAAQFLQLRPFEIVPIRGNVPTRIQKLDDEQLDGIVLAAAGLTRLGIEHPRMLPLPVEHFTPAPAQGALAIQTRKGDAAEAVCAALNDEPTRRCISAERTFLARINAGCHTPVGALAHLDGDDVVLHAKLFTDDYQRVAEATDRHVDAATLGRHLADHLLSELAEG